MTVLLANTDGNTVPTWPRAQSKRVKGGAPHICALWLSSQIPRRVLWMLHRVKDEMPESKRTDCWSSEVQRNKDTLGNPVLRVKYPHPTAQKDLFLSRIITQ